MSGIIFNRGSPKLDKTKEAAKNSTGRSSSNIIVQEISVTESTTFPKTLLKTFSKILPPKSPPVAAEENQTSLHEESAVDLKAATKIEFTTVLVGEPGVGKTSLISRYIFKKYEKTSSTPGPTFYAKNFYYSDTINGMEKFGRLRYQIWDLPGSEYSRQIVSNWIKTSKLIFIFFSLVDPTSKSYNSMKFMVDQTYILSTVENPIIVIIGTKLDKVEKGFERTVPASEVDQFINDNGLLYYEVSSKSGQNVEFLFNDLGKKLLINTIRERGGLPPVWIPNESTQCCTICKILFSFIVRRHHCRNCGNIFCGSCSSKSIKIPRIGHTSPVRVCDNCYQLIKA